MSFVSPGIVVRNCGDVRVSRSRGFGDDFGGYGSNGMSVFDGSVVQVSGCFLAGSDSRMETSIGLSGWGGHGLAVYDSTVWVSDSDLMGGDGEDYFNSLFGYFEAGQGGHGLFSDSSSVDVRGRGDSVLQGGYQNPDESGDEDGVAASCDLTRPIDSHITLSGIEAVGGLSDCATTAVPMRPLLIVQGQDGPGLVRRALLFGTAGENAFLVSSLGADTASLPVLTSSLLWVAFLPSVQVQAGVLAGFAGPLTFSWTQPPSPMLAGVTLHLQGFQAVADGTFQGTNAASFTLSF